MAKKKPKYKTMLKSSKARLLAAAALILLFTLGARALTNGGDEPSTHRQPQGSSTSQPNGAQPNLSPASDNERSADDSHKDALVQQQANSGSQPQASSVTPIITSASSEGVNGFITGVFEDGGSCTFIFTQGSSSFTKTTAGFKNATSTNCTPLSLSDSDFPSDGTWNVVLSYSSSTVSKVNSQPAKIQR